MNENRQEKGKKVKKGEKKKQKKIRKNVFKNAINVEKMPNIGKQEKQEKSKFLLGITKEKRQKNRSIYVKKANKSLKENKFQ